MTQPDSSAVERALADVAITQARLNELQLSLAEGISKLTDRILLLGLDLDAAGRRADRDLIHRLYWDAPSLSTHAIYQALGLRSPNDVSAIAAPREVHVPCKDCATVGTHQVKNRTGFAKLRSSNRCESCTAEEVERARRHQVELEDEWRRRKWAADDALERAMQTVVLAHPDLHEEPPAAKMYVTIPVSEWRGTTVRLRDLYAVRDELRDRRRDPDAAR